MLQKFHNKGTTLMWLEFSSLAPLNVRSLHVVSPEMLKISMSKTFGRAPGIISIFMIMMLRETKRQKFIFLRLWKLLFRRYLLHPRSHFHLIFLYYSIDNDLYIGTDADFSGNDPIIYREPLQTDQYDSLSLNGEISGRWALQGCGNWQSS